MGRLNDTTGTLPGRSMQVGEQRVYIPDPKNAPDRRVIVTRTTREYVYDLCDAYNEARTSDAVEWFVTRKGELQLRAKNERVHEATPWKPSEAEIAQFRRNMARIGSD